MFGREARTPVVAFGRDEGVELGEECDDCSEARSKSAIVTRKNCGVGFGLRL